MTTSPRRIRTDTLLRRLTQTGSLDEALRQNEPHMVQPDFPAYLNMLCAEKGQIPERVILQADIERSYGHQLFNGTRKPSRDKVIQLAFGLGLDVAECQALLRVAGKSPLYPRLRRDAVLIFCLSHGISVLEAQELLVVHHLTQLGGASAYEGMV